MNKEFIVVSLFNGMNTGRQALENVGIKVKKILFKRNKTIRSINQIEMERLQGFPDGYTSILSKRKAGSLLGDAWTLPVIEHIFKFIQQ